MPSTLPPSRVLRSLLHTPVSTRQEAHAIEQAVEDLAAACQAQADDDEVTPDEHMPLLLMDLIELGPQLQALGDAMAVSLPQLSGTQRAALLQQVHAALYLLQVLCPMPFGMQTNLGMAAVDSLARGTGAMLAAKAAILTSLRQPEEQPEHLQVALHTSVCKQLDCLGIIAWSCWQLDAFAFRQPVACTALAAHALNDSTGVSWVAAVTAVLSSSGGSNRGSGIGIRAVDLFMADGLARLLALPQATALHCAVRSDSQLQQRLLQLLLPAGVSAIPSEQQGRLRPSSLPTCIAALVELTPDASAAHMATPAGLRSLQAASQQLLHLHQEVQRQQRQQRREQRQAVMGGQPQDSQTRISAVFQSESAALQPLARVRLFASLASRALQPPGGSSERAAVVCRLVADTLPAVAAAAVAALMALPQVSRVWQEAWIHAGHAFHNLALALFAAARSSVLLTQSGFDSAAAALLAALQLRALLSSLEEAWRVWQQELREGVPADPTVPQNLIEAADATEDYCRLLASQLAHLSAQQAQHSTQAAQEGSAGTSAEQEAGQGALSAAAGGASAAAAAVAGRQLEAVARAHTSCASLLHLLTAESGADIWGLPGRLPAALNGLHVAASLLWNVTSQAGQPGAAGLCKMDAVVLAHVAALQLGLQACPDGCSTADARSLALACPNSCLPVAAATGAAAVVQKAMERRSQFVGQTAGANSPEPPLLAALQAEERRHAEQLQGPEQRDALALRIERAKALRPCASLACPHLAAKPQLRGKVCSGCRTVRYCCAEDQAQDWRQGGHRAARRLLCDASAGGGRGGGSGAA